jgi:uncharacterized protein involved in outer membrane biogenesis
MAVEAKNFLARYDRARLKRAAKWLFGSSLAIAVFGFLVLPPIARHFGEQAIADALGRAVTIERIEINPFRLSATATGFRIAEADGQPGAFSLATLHANLEAESIYRGGPVLSELRIEAPQVRFERIDAARHNWSDVIERLAARPKTEDDTPALFSLNNIQVINGTVVIDDRTVGVRNELSAINVGLPFLSNLPVKVKLFVEPSVSALINGRPLQIAGRSRPFSDDRETLLDIKLDSFDFTPHFAYLPFKPAFKLVEGQLSTDLELSFGQNADAGAQLSVKGSVNLASVRLQDTAGNPLLSIPGLTLGVADVQPLVGKLHFDRLEIDRPVVDLVRLANGRLNFQEILPPAGKEEAASGAPPAEPGAATAPMAFAIDNVKITGATVRVEDRAAGHSGFRTELRELQLEARNLGNAPDAVADIALDFSTDAGEKSSHRDRVRLSPFELEGRTVAENFLVSRYTPYYGAQLPGGEVRNGRFDATVQYKFKTGTGDPQIELLAESLVLREFELALNGQKQPAVKVPRLALSGVAVAPAARSVTIGGVESKGASFALIKDRQGKLDLLGMLGEPAAAPPTTTTPPKTPAAPADSATAAGPWVVAVNRLALDNWSVRFEDRTQGNPIVMLAEGIKLNAEGLSTAKGTSTRLNLGASINKRGRVGVTGSVGLEPLKGELRLDLRSVDLLPLQPYVVEQVNIAISRGNLSTRGALAFESVRDGSISGRFRGDLGVEDFASIDKLQATDFLRWRKLDVNGIDLHTAPFALAVKDIALTDFYTRLILDEQGRLNLREIRPRPQGESAPAPTPENPPPAAGAKAEINLPPAPAAPPPPISIGRIGIKQGNIAFSDRFIRPNYDANLTGMEGELVGLSSDPSTIASLDLRGKVDNAAPVTVAGRLNPFRQDSFLDIAASVKDFELTAVSAYSGKYVGYGIQKGKLSADLNYKIEDRKLSATNRIFLDQFTFGDKVDSPTALDLPVNLAVSLLRNNRGEIDLNMPVGGSLDDPEFSVAGIVIKAIINLIGKALTAPFALLGSMFGGGEELSHVDFPPGRSSFDTGNSEKIATLARALADRPALKLEIVGRADPASDPDGIRRVMLERSIKAAKLKEMVRKGEEAPSLDDMTLSDEEYGIWLKRVYRDADFKRPRNAIGLLKDLPVPEMEALMLANTGVDDEALRQLAQQRAQTIKDKLLADGKIAAERVFLMAPKVGAATGNKEEEGAARRTLFALK